jgi:long-chain acyl-CoA synthetase
MKLRRGEIAAAVAAGEAEQGGETLASMGSGPRSVMAEVVGRDVANAEAGARLAEDLGLTSLERVELLSRIESRYGVELDETQFAAMATVGDLEAFVNKAESATPKTATLERPAADGHAVQAGEFPSQPPHPRAAAPDWLLRPRWARTGPVRWLRAAMLDLFVLPMVRELVRLKVEGIEHLSAIEPPVIFAANHASHFDTAAVLGALPRGWRRRLAPAMSQDYFRAVFDTGASASDRSSALGQFLLACGLFNAYPLPQKLGGTRRALRYSGELVDHGYCPLIFPEGFRTPDGRIHPFQSGVGLMAARLGVPVVPFHIEGTFEVYSVHHQWPKEGRVRVRFGAPLDVFPGEDIDAFAARVEQAVRKLSRGG